MLTGNKKRAHLQNYKQFPLFIASAALWQDNFSKPAQYAFLVVSNIHCIIIMLFAQFKFIYSDLSSTYLSRIYDIIRLFTFKDIYTSDNKSVLLNLFYIAIWIYFIVMIRAFYSIIKAFKQDRSLARTSNHFFTFLGQFHLAFGFWFINVVIMDKLSLFQDDSFRIGGLTNNGHFMYALSIILILLNYIIGIYFALLSCDPFIGFNELAIHTINYQALTFVFKAVSAPLLTVGVFESVDTSKWIMTLISAVILLVRHFTLVDTLPYYELLPMKLTGAMSIASVPVSIMTFISISAVNWDWIIINNVFVVEVILCCLLVTYWLNTFNRIALENVAIDDSLLKTENQVIKKLFGLRYLLRSSRMAISEGNSLEYNEVCYWGMMAIYKSDDNFTESFKKQYRGPKLMDETDENSIKTVRSYNTQFGHRILYNFLKSALEKIDHSHNTKIKILMDCLSLGQSNALIASIARYKSFKNSSQMVQIVVARLKSKFQENLNLLFSSNDEKTLNIKEYIDLETVSAEFLRSIHHNTNSYIELWTTFIKDDFSVKHLFEKSKKIEEQHTLIEKHWDYKISKERSIANALSMIYSIYLSLVKSKPSLAYKILDKDRLQKDFAVIYDSKNEPILQSNLNSLSTMAFHVSMLRENIGKIMHVSSNTRDILGWTRADTVGKSINMILPSMMQERHNLLLLNYLNKVAENPNEGTSSFFKNINSFVKDRSGHLFPCYVYLSIHPYAQDDLIFVAFLRVDKTKRSQILLSENGYVEECSRQIAIDLKLRTDRKVHIRDICEDSYVIESLLKKQTKSYLIGPKSLAKIKKSTVLDINQLQSFDAPDIEKSDAGDTYDYINTKDLVLNFQVPKQHSRGKECESQPYYVQVTKNTFQNLNFFVLDLHEYKNKASKHITTQQPATIPEPLTENDVSDIPEEKGNEENTEIMTLPVFRYLPKESLTKRRVIETEGFTSTENIQITAKIEETKEDCLSPTTGGERDKLLRTTVRKREAEVQAVVEVVKDKKAMLWNMLGAKNMEGEMSVASSRGHNIQIEKTVGATPKNRKLTALKIVGLLFLLFSAGLLLSFQFENENTMNKVKGNIDILSNASLRLTLLCNVNKFERFYILNSLGLITLNRFAMVHFTGPSLYAIVSAIPEFLKEVKNVSVEISNSLYQIDESLQASLFNEIPLYDTMDNGTVGIVKTANIFDLITEIYVKSASLLKVAPYSVKIPDSRITFVMNNTLNYPLITGEETISVLIDDTKLKLDTQRNNLIICIVSIVFTGLIVWALFYNTVKNSVLKRNHFIDILLRLDEEYIKKNNEMVAKFASVLESNHMDYKSLNVKIDEDNFITPPPTKQSHRITRKNASLKGLNVLITVLSLLMFVFVLLALTMYLVIFGIMNSQANSTMYKISLMATSNLNLYKASLLSTTLYEYIYLNKTTKIKNVPIEVGWPQLYEELATTQDFLINDILNTETGLGNNPTLVKMISGNICDIIATGSNGYYKLLCNTLAYDMLRSGIIGVTSFQLATLQRVKSYFDNSNRTFANMFTALNMNDFILLEIVDYYFAYLSYKEINTLIQQTLFSDIDSTIDSFRKTIVIYAVIWVLLGLVVWYMITQALEKETNKWRKMMRQVPYGILVTNKLFMNFLFKEGKHTVGSKFSYR